MVQYAIYQRTGLQYQACRIPVPDGKLAEAKAVANQIASVNGVEYTEVNETEEMLTAEKNREIETSHFCRKCGESLLENARFCMKCGTEILEESNYS